MLALRLHDERHARAGREKAAAVHSATAPSAPSCTTPGPCQGRCTTARLGRSRMAAVSPCVAHLASPLLPPALHLRPRAGRIWIKTGTTHSRIRRFFQIFSYAKNSLLVCFCLFLGPLKNRVQNCPKALLEVTHCLMVRVIPPWRHVRFNM